MLKFIRFMASQNYPQTHVWVICWDDSKNREVQYLVEQISVKIEKNRMTFSTDNADYVAHLFYI